jgi:hypothetical protein
VNAKPKERHFEIDVVHRCSPGGDSILIKHLGALASETAGPLTNFSS